MISDQELIERLESAGRSLDVPDVDVVPTVLTALDGPPTRLRAWPRLAVPVALGLLLLAAAVVADLVPGLGLTPAERPPSDAAPLDRDRDLGQPASPDSAAMAAGLAHIRMPNLAWLPDPEVFVDGRLVHLVYPPTDDLPEMAGSGVGLLVTQWAADVDDQVLIKAVPGDGVEPVTIGDVGGWWIVGPHEVVPVGDHTTGQWRRTQDVLVWHRDGVTFRLETSLPRAEAETVARSLDP